MAVEWTIIDEIRLFRWAAEFKPAGIHKHFHMLCILERMNHPEKYPLTLLQKESVRAGKLFTATEIWEKLSQYYNLPEMDKLEDQIVQPVPKSDVGQEETEKTMLEHKFQFAQRKDFGLPWDEYGELILENAKTGPLDEELGHNELNEKQRDNKQVKNEVKEPHEIVDKDSNSHEEKSLTPPDAANWDRNTPQLQTLGKRRSTRLRKSTRINQANNEKNSEDENDGESGEIDGESEKEMSEDANVHSETKHKLSAIDDEVDKFIKEKSPDQFDKGKEEEEDAEIKESSLEEKMNMKQSEEVTGKEKGEEMDKLIIATKEEDEGKEEQEDEKEQEQEQEQEGEEEEEEDDTGEDDIGEDEDDTVDQHNGNSDNQPLAERTRQSSSVGSTTAETSPKRKKRNTEQPPNSSKRPRASMRVSSRLRNRKQ